MSDSVNAGIQFIRYKMDHIELDVTQTLGVLNSSGDSDCECAFQIGFFNPICYKNAQEALYVVSLLAKLELRDKDKIKIASGKFKITGLFKGVGDLDKKIEEKLIKFQAPAILFPFLRANISSILLNAGFSQIQMPLINVNEMANGSDISIDYRN